MKSIKKVIIVVIVIFITWLLIKPYLRPNYFDFLESRTLRDKVVWTEINNLNWSDFQFDEDFEGTYSQVGLSTRYNVNEPILFRSKTVFDPEKSYSSDTTGMFELRVAQAKFDLLEIYRRKMVKEVDSLREIKNLMLVPNDFDIMTDRYYKLFKKEWQKYLEQNIDSKLISTIEERIKVELNEK